MLWAYQGLVEKRALQAEKELMGSQGSLDQEESVEKMDKKDQRETKDFLVLDFVVLKEKRASVVCASHQRLAVATPISKCLEALGNQALQDRLDLLALELKANRVHQVQLVLKEKREIVGSRGIKDLMVPLESQVCLESQVWMDNRA